MNDNFPGFTPEQIASGLATSILEEPPALCPHDHRPCRYPRCAVCPLPGSSELDRLKAAARLALDTLANLTAEDFARGVDRPARIALACALGLDPQDYVL